MLAPGIWWHEYVALIPIASLGNTAPVAIFARSLPDLIPETLDQPVGYIVQGKSNHAWLAAYIQRRITTPLQQRAMPPSGRGAKRIPGMAGNKT